jgi:hypothetical protein
MHRVFYDLLGSDAARELMEQFPVIESQEPVTKQQLDLAFLEHERNRRSWWSTLWTDLAPLFVTAAISLAFVVGVAVGEHSSSP